MTIFQHLIPKNSAVNKAFSMVFLLLFSTASLLNAQTKTAPNQGGYWLSYAGDNKINKKIGIHSELQWRNMYLDHSVQSILTRVGLNVYISPQAMATVGYGFIYSEPTEQDVIGSKVFENRVWEQLILRQKSRNVFIEHRYRLEQRFLNNVTNGTNQLDHRLRYRFQTLFPLYSINPKLRHYFVAFNNEVFINLKKEPSRLFDRNRMFVGLGYQVSPKMNFQLGYLNQYINIPGNPRAQVDHIALLGMSYNMDDLMQTFFNRK